MSLATQVLKYSSKRAVELWHLLKQTKDESDIEILTTSFLTAQIRPGSSHRCV